MFDASNPLLVCRSQSVTVADGRIRVLSNTFGQIRCRSPWLSKHQRPRLHCLNPGILLPVAGELQNDSTWSFSTFDILLGKTPRNGVRRTDRPPLPDHCENDSLTHHRTLSSVLSQIHRQVKDALPTPGKELFCLTINKNRGEEVKRYLTANTRFGRKSLSSALLLQSWERRALLRAPAIRPVLGQQNSRHEGGSQPNHRHELDMCSLCLSYSLLCSAVCKSDAAKVYWSLPVRWVG